MATPLISQTVQPPIAGVSNGTLIGGVSAGSSNPGSPGQNTLSTVANQNGFGTGVQAGGSYGDLYSPINQGQQASLFQQPQNVAGVNNSVGQNIQQGFNNYTNQTSPMAGLIALGAASQAGTPQINTGVSNALTSAQLNQINMLNAQALGQGPSLAAVQAQQTGQQNVANQMAMIASQRGGSGNTALGLRNAQNAIAGANQQAVQAAVQGRTAEELNAEQQLTGALGTAQGQTMQGAQAQAQLQANANLANAGYLNQNTLQQGAMNQQTNLANLQSQLGTMGLNAQEYNAMLQAMQNQANAQYTGQQNYANLVNNYQLGSAGIAAGVDVNNTNNMMGLYGAGIAGGAALGAAGIGAASDIRLKTNIRSGNRSMKEFLNKIASV